MSKPDEKTYWTRYLPVAMGMIHPEWLFMGHLFENEEPENEAENDTDASVSPVPSLPLRSSIKEIQINFRSRK
ncbi:MULTISPECIES: hypothetical protein [Thermoactinomyces]|jgi:hypothetical protein|uniref:Uncharacterized protein n=1 Tax=Thermoactinomyces daqus TaxID=1329516 RepID=A0A7W2AJA3_9BACL|nr:MULTISPECIES: hypothetical protein [Thermoactinomyces]MBA4543733.1 hypothetical protein [Thermoactinomyces daqus]MBH8597514.1 hypothetical protein [Thermoactinomyces sp. CICC 10523]MBH8603855.1 hypothetical protein [Thermoactinomyces sp. CICC 10522]MBH8608535.1 hypothetical protein [Thermoactinomyces sp. CICC 10521]